MAAAKVNAKRHDATGEAVSVEFNGDTYEVPPGDEWGIDVLEAFDDQRITHVLKALLGAEQYDTFRKRNTKARAIAEFMEAMQEAAGAGNS